MEEIVGGDVQNAPGHYGKPGFAPGRPRVPRAYLLAPSQAPPVTCSAQAYLRGTVTTMLPFARLEVRGQGQLAELKGGRGVQKEC